MYPRSNVTAKRRSHALGMTLDDAALDRFKRAYESSGRRLVVCMSHTHVHDLYVALALLTGHGIPLFFVIRQAVLARLPACIVPNNVILVRNGQSTVDETVRRLRQAGEFLLLIRPFKVRAHSSYWNVAQQCGAQLLVGGFDYMTRTTYVSPRTWDPLFDGPNTTYADFARRVEPELIEAVNHAWPIKPRDQLGFSPDVYHRLWGHDDATVRRLERRGIDSADTLRRMCVQEVGERLAGSLVAVIIGCVMILVLVAWMIRRWKK